MFWIQSSLMMDQILTKKPEEITWDSSEKMFKLFYHTIDKYSTFYDGYKWWKTGNRRYLPQPPTLRHFCGRTILHPPSGIYSMKYNTTFY